MMDLKEFYPILLPNIPLFQHPIIPQGAREYMAKNIID
jgi:hypothetical protein